MSNKKKKKTKPQQSDNLSIKGTFDDVIGVTVGIIPNTNNTPNKPKSNDKKPSK